MVIFLIIISIVLGIIVVNTDFTFVRSLRESKKTKTSYLENKKIALINPYQSFIDNFVTNVIKDIDKAFDKGFISFYREGDSKGYYNPSFRDTIDYNKAEIEKRLESHYFNHNFSIVLTCRKTCIFFKVQEKGFWEVVVKYD